MRRTLVYLTASLALAACRAEGGSHRGSPAAAAGGVRRDVLGALPVMPRALLRDTTGTSEAQSRTYSTLAAPDSVRQYFLRQLDTLGWRVQADQQDQAQATMYATRDSGAVWLRIWSDSGVTFYTLIGTTARPSTGERQPPLPLRPGS